MLKGQKLKNLTKHSYYTADEENYLFNLVQKLFLSVLLLLSETLEQNSTIMYQNIEIFCSFLRF